MNIGYHLCVKWHHEVKHGEQRWLRCEPRRGVRAYPHIAATIASQVMMSIAVIVVITVTIAIRVANVILVMHPMLHAV